MPGGVAVAPWVEALGGTRLLVSGFGKWGGGAYDLTSGSPEALDDLPTSGLAAGGGRLWRLLRAPGEQTSVCELLAYDERGVRAYHRLDDVRDPHDVCWYDGAVHVTSSWDDTVWRVSPAGDVAPAWQAGSGVPDGWHLNSLTVVDGALHACAFGRSDRHKGWKDAARRDTGFVRDLRAGRDVLRGLCQPHTPRRSGDRWYVCESLIGTLTECAADGTILRRASIERFTRGLAIVAGRWALVGGNGHRADEGDRAELVVVDLTTMAEVERIGLPCLEVYDIVAVPAPLARGLALGFGANPARAVEQHRAEDRPAATRPTPPEARVRLAPPRVASALSTMGQALDPASVAGCGVRGALPARAVAGTATVVTIEVVNRSRRPLASVPPRIVRVAARWIPLPAPSPAPRPGGRRPGAWAGAAGARRGAEPGGPAPPPRAPGREGGRRPPRRGPRHAGPLRSAHRPQPAGPGLVRRPPPGHGRRPPRPHPISPPGPLRSTSFRVVPNSTPPLRPIRNKAEHTPPRSWTRRVASSPAPHFGMRCNGPPSAHACETARVRLVPNSRRATRRIRNKTEQVGPRRDGAAES